MSTFLEYLTITKNPFIQMTTLSLDQLIFYIANFSCSVVIRKDGCLYHNIKLQYLYINNKWISVVENQPSRPIALMQPYNLWEDKIIFSPHLGIYTTYYKKKIKVIKGDKSTALLMLCQMMQIWQLQYSCQVIISTSNFIQIKTISPYFVS